MRVPSIFKQFTDETKSNLSENPTPLSLSISEEYPDKPEMSARFAAVGRHGGESIYSLLAFNLSKPDIQLAEALKSSIIQRFIALGQYNPKNGIAEAEKLAAELLSGYATNSGKEFLAYLIAHETMGTGPFSMLMDDSEHIEEIVVNSPESNIYIYHSLYGFCKTNIKFTSERSFRYMLNKLIAATEKEINTVTPVIDAQLPDGSRLHAQTIPYSINGTSATIRLPGGSRLDVKELLKNGTADSDILSYIWLAMDAKSNIIISGAPSSGKTTMLSALASFSYYYRRIISIEEDVNEIRLGEGDSNYVALQGGTRDRDIHVKDQVINALHMRPDLLIVGEIRGEEAREIFFGANVGVQFITTMHSNLDKTALVSRLSTKPMSVEPQALCMLDIAIFMKSNGLTERKIDKIVEYRWLARDEMQVPENRGAEFEAHEVVSEGRINQEELKNSKIIARFSTANLLTKGNVLKEMKKRAAFLQALTLPINVAVNSRAYIRKYGAIS